MKGRKQGCEAVGGSSWDEIVKISLGFMHEFYRNKIGRSPENPLIGDRPELPFSVDKWCGCHIRLHVENVPRFLQNVIEPLRQSLELLRQSRNRCRRPAV
jgi:hypothetical protein